MEELFFRGSGKVEAGGRRPRPASPLAARLDTFFKQFFFEIFIGDTALHGASQEEKAAFRRNNVGFVFQSYQLFDSYTALENVQFPLELTGLSDQKAKSRAMALLEQVGLGDRMAHYPRQLSGGEQQRVSVARAFATRPRLLLADEPTGNLDKKNAKNIFSLLTDLANFNNSSLIVATHDIDMSSMLDKSLRIKNGSLEEL